MEFIQAHIDQLSNQGLLRSLKVQQGVDFSSNDYLGLSDNNEIRERLIQELQRGIPLGSTGSRLISGHTVWHEEAEQFLAKFVSRESSLIFNSGYCANEGVISALAKDSLIFSDQLNHASIIRGIKLSGSPYKIYRHFDLDHLEHLLKESPTKVQKFIITESLFSMDGDLAPLKSMIKLAEKYCCHLIVDEAHATGALGVKGGGCLSELSFDAEKVVSIHTGGKALGAQGAFVACSLKVKQYLINCASHFIYSTAPSPLQCAHLKYSAQYIVDRPELIVELQRKAKYAREKIAMYFDVGRSEAQIIPIILSNNQTVLNYAKKLKEKSFSLMPIRFPTVKAGEERLRLCIHSTHDLSKIDSLIDELLHVKESEIV